MFGIPKAFPLFVLFLAGCGFTVGLYDKAPLGIVLALVIGGVAAYWLWDAIPPKPSV